MDSLATLSLNDLLGLAQDSIDKKRKHAECMQRYRHRNAEHFRQVYRQSYHNRKARKQEAQPITN